MKRMAIAPIFLTALTLVGCVPMNTAADKSVSFVEPKDGATVTSPFKVVFAVKGMAVEPAGEIKANDDVAGTLQGAGPPLDRPQAMLA